MASEIATDELRATQADDVRKPETEIDSDLAASMEAVEAADNQATSDEVPATATVPAEQDAKPATEKDAVDLAVENELLPDDENDEDTDATGEDSLANAGEPADYGPTAQAEESAEAVVSEEAAVADADSVEEVTAEDSKGASDEESTGEPGESTGDSTDAETTKPGLVARIVGGAKQNVKTIGACGGSLVLGAGMMFLFGGSSAPAPIVEEVEPKPVYFASLIRRNEPIAPVVPFENLEPGIVLLGEKLFHDPGLSRNGKIACASCHDINKGGDDGRSLPIGFDDAPGIMNTPSVLTAALNHAQFWDGRAETLEEQVDSPITNPTEMNSDWPRVLKYLRNNQRYNTSFVDHMGGEPTEETVRTALATYQRAILTVGSPFDQWLQGNENALTSDAYAGYHLFKKMNCVNCHNGENIGGHIFEPLGKVKDYFTEQRPATQQDLGRFNVTANKQDKYVFRVPTLRNIELTAPYLHDGSVETLQEVVELMIEYQVGLEANPEDVRRIVLFLQSLTAPVPEMPKLPPKSDLVATP